MNDVSSVEFWNNRYKDEDTSWDLGEPTPVFTDWRKANPGDGRRVCVLGAGSGYDVIALAQDGYKVTAVDFAPLATERIKQAGVDAGIDVDVITGDLFNLADDHAQQFDIVLEYTTYCAIDPNRRDEYIDVVSKLVPAGGMFLALFWPVNKAADTGPPFRVTPDEIDNRFSKYFNLETQFWPENSVQSRHGKEILAEYKRK